MIKFLKRKYERIFEKRNFIEMIIYTIIYGFNRFCFFQVMRVCLLNSKDVKVSFNANADFDFKRVTPQELKQYDYNKQRISDDAINFAHINGDIVYITILKDTQKIVSYGWYSPNPTVINNRYVFTFPNTYLYMYNGYTEPEYRGFRLHALGMQYGALDSPRFARDGLVSYIDAENYRSIHSCKRLGYQFVGYIFIFKLFNRDYIFHSYGIKKLKVTLEMHNQLNKN